MTMKALTIFLVLRHFPTFPPVNQSMITSMRNLYKFAFILMLTCGFLVSFASTSFAESEKPVEPRTLTKKIEDSAITFRLSNQITKSKSELGSDTQVNVTTVNGVVLLTGAVETAEAKQWVEDLSNEHPDVRKVVNELRVEKPRTPLAIGKDKVLQISVKHRISTQLKDMSPKVHVVVYRNTVYLMGVVPEDIADEAARIAQNTRSSERVVTIFELQTVSKSQT